MNELQLYGRVISKEKMIAVATLLREKKELRNIPDTVTEKMIKTYLEQHTRTLDHIVRSSKIEKSEILPLIKSIRSKLRRMTGAFEESFDLSEAEKEEIFNLIKSQGPLEKFVAIAKYHHSLSEREGFLIAFTQFLYSGINAGDSILDIGCGLFPLLSFAKEIPAVEYHAYDISKGLTDFIQECAKSGKKKIHAISLDVSSEKISGKYRRVFALKLFDLISHKRVEELFDTIDAEEFYCSFSTITIAGKKMNQPRRAWFAKLIRRRNWTYEIREFENEIVYVVKK